VDAVDTTGAGDAFCGALAAALAAGCAPLDALRRASAAGALTATAVGAQAQSLSAEAIDRLVGAPV
jgi:ribokinase